VEPTTVTGSTAPPGPRTRTKLIALAALAALVVYAVTRPSNATVFEPSGTPRALPAAGELTEMSADEFEGVLVGLRGTPVIVNIWASWCSPCRTETPLLERTWKTHGDEVTILGVGSKDVPSNLLAFMNEFGVSYPNVFDSSGEIRARLGLRGFPTTYVFGADGKLRTTIVGGLTEQRLAAVLQDLRA
jgi:cytochrome c biogenesis protein CcmG, thiol:disulfide interchange protein DsbE